MEMLQPVQLIMLNLVGEHWDSSGSFIGQRLCLPSFRNSIKRLYNTPVGTDLFTVQTVITIGLIMWEDRIFKFESSVQQSEKLI
jgi:hypothetical protein